MAKNEPKKMKIAAVGDIHAQSGLEAELNWLFQQMAEKADVIVLCGDLTDQGTIPEAELLLREIQSITKPMVAVLGNHDYQSDQPDQIKQILAPKITFLENKPIEIEGVGFAGVKGFGGGFDNHLLGSFGESGIKNFVQEAINESLALENALNQLKTKKKVVVLHYSPISFTLRGEPQQLFPFLGSSRLAEPIDRFDVTMAFHGHAHYGSYDGKTNKGIPIYNCSQEVMKRKNIRQPFALVEI